MENKSLLAKCEALLFLHGEPISLKKMEDILELSAEDCNELLNLFEKKLEEEDRGLCLIRHQGKIQLVTKSDFYDILEIFMKKELSDDLTPASLEALSIVLYLGPISRARIEYLRGVNSMFILRSLLIRGLIERFSDPEKPNSFLYRPSFDTLRYLGLNKTESLPQYEKFKNLLTSIQ